MGSNEYTVNPEPTFGDASTEAFASDPSSGVPYHKTESKLWKIIGIVSLIVSFISIILASWGYSQAKSMNYLGPSSCSKFTGPTGIYYLKTDVYFDPYPVYCDMDSAGGGWTLVAAVHENNIKGKCTVGDLWSSEQGIGTSPSYNGSKNWENFNTFGNIYSLTHADFKNIAYYELKAKNVMIWHVPNSINLGEFSSRAFLKYYTTNNILESYGGTLQSLYSNYAPMVHAGASRFFSLISAPVTYIKGSNETIMSGIPLTMRKFVEPGFVQFRAFDISGFPNALCPGFRIRNGNSARVCIGSGGLTRISNTRISYNSCGDYAGWEGNGSNPGLQDKPSDTGKSQNDINSSIFIFVR